MQLQLDFQVVMTYCRAQDIGLQILIHNPTNGFHSPMKSLESQSNRSAFHQSRLQWDFRKQGNPTAIERNAGGMQPQWDRCNPGSIGSTQVQSRGKGAVRVRSAIKPNLTAVRQV